MDEERVLAELRVFLGLTQSRYHEGYYTLLVPESQVTAAAQIAEQLLDRVLPDWRTSVPGSGYDSWQRHRVATERAIAQLERQAELSEMLGDSSPQMSAAGLHPWVWDGARSLWQSGHRREAVRSAAVKVNAETQNKVSTRALAETALFLSAFSDDPPKPTLARLRLPEDDGGKTAVAVRRGIRMYAEGCYAAIRNPSSHDDLGELPEQEALEQLAAFSVLARWVDRAQLRA